jgi:hypothetical protein
MLVHELLPGLPPAGLHIADSYTPQIGLFEHGLEVIGATRAYADDTERDAFGRCCFPISAEGSRGYEKGGGEDRACRRLFEKISPR